MEKFSHIPTSLKDTTPTHFPEEVSKFADHNVILTHPEIHDTMEDENDAEKDISVADKPIAKIGQSGKGSGVIEEGIVTTFGTPASDSFEEIGKEIREIVNKMGAFMNIHQTIKQLYSNIYKLEQNKERHNQRGDGAPLARELLHPALARLCADIHPLPHRQHRGGEAGVAHGRRHAPWRGDVCR